MNAKMRLGGANCGLSRGVREEYLGSEDWISVDWKEMISKERRRIRTIGLPFGGEFAFLVGCHECRR